MQIIKIHHPMQPDEPLDQPVVLAMGFFDGVHRGHQAVIRRAKAIADERGLTLAVLTYDHHPALVYRPLTEADYHYLTVPQRKFELFKQLGVGVVYQVGFTSQLSALTPQEFVDQYLVRFHAEVVVAGFDHTYGPKDTGNMDRLPEYAKDRFAIETVARHEEDDKKISSTRIRQNLADGHLNTVNQLLGYRYLTMGTVVHGEARGRTLGFPTANISHDTAYALPGIGVYVTRVKIGSDWYQAMTSVGRNVTFGENRPITVEAYLLDFDAAIYGEVVQVEWETRLRGEVKFSSVDALVDQLKADEQATRDYFNRQNPRISTRLN